MSDNGTPLTSLDARWIVVGGREVGVHFTCPGKSWKIAVLFSNPFDGGPPASNDQTVVGNNNGNRWERRGDSLHNLTLSPSVDAGDGAHGYVIGGAWFFC